MTKLPTRSRDTRTVTVTGSQTMFRPDGWAGIRIETRELGAIAFELNQQAIDALRRQLVDAEQFLRQQRTASKH